MFNLLSNALKYTPAGGEIFVSLKDEGANLRLDVKDTGKGISQDEADKIFERFFQAKGAASGTGIGLALVKSFVELHHGEARVESELGKGSDFIVVIPREQEGDSQVIHNDVDIVDNYFPKRVSPIFTTSPAPIVINNSLGTRFSRRNFSISPNDSK